MAGDLTARLSGPQPTIATVAGRDVRTSRPGRRKQRTLFAIREQTGSHRARLAATTPNRTRATHRPDATVRFHL
ncbi:hypothetical protein, partial [Burkholderia sp.]|uniref:hypothetical protein n=1 Tax=Burkholderia sp. TaxID=36773 RepID=UPI0025BFB936